MLSFVHLLVGAAIGKYLGNIWIIIPIAFLSHYLLDFIPHYQGTPIKGYKEFGLRGMNKEDFAIKSIEPIAGVLLTLCLILINTNPALPMLTGAFFSILPDFILFFKWKYNSKFAALLHQGKESRFHKHTHFKWGMITQLIVVIIAILYLVGF